MDVAALWRSLRTDPAKAPHIGAHQATAGEEITINIAQTCRVALPPRRNLIPEVSVTITSNRPGVAAQVTIGANLNSPDGSYQGPTTTVGQGQFTATVSEVRTGFVILPSGWPVLGVGAEAIWADGSPHSVTLAYVQIACDPMVGLADADCRRSQSRVLAQHGLDLIPLNGLDLRQAASRALSNGVFIHAQSSVR